MACQIFTRVHFHSIFNGTNIIAATLSPECGPSRVNSPEMFRYFVFTAAAAACVACAMCVYVRVCGYTVYISILWLLPALQRSGLVVTCGRALHPPLPFLFLSLKPSSLHTMIFPRCFLCVSLSQLLLRLLCIEEEALDCWPTFSGFLVTVFYEHLQEAHVSSLKLKYPEKLAHS